MNTISNLWNGRFGLAKTYWLWGVLSGIPWGIALSLVKPGSNLAILVVLAVFVYYVIVHFGIWRAASEYEGAKAWAILAKIAVAITPACLVIGTLAAVIIPAKHQLSTQGQQTTPAPLGKPSNPTVSSTLPPCSEGETRIAGDPQCLPWSAFTPIDPELIPNEAGISTNLPGQVTAHNPFPELIPNEAGISTNVKGISPDGKLLIQIINDTRNWEIRHVSISLTDSQQHVDFLNGYRSTPAYSEQYSTDVSISPKNFHSLEIQTAWDFHRGYLTKIDAFGYKKN